jgi:hypothetical protein
VAQTIPSEDVELLLCRQGAALDAIAGSIRSRSTAELISRVRREVSAALEALQAEHAGPVDTAEAVRYRRFPWDRP